MFNPVELAQMKALIERFFLPWLAANGVTIQPKLIGLDPSFDKPEGAGEAPFVVVYHVEGKSPFAVDGAELARQINRGRQASAGAMNGDLFSIQDYVLGQHHEPAVAFVDFAFPVQPKSEQAVAIVGAQVNVDNPNLDATRKYFQSNASDGQQVILRAGNVGRLAEGVEVIHEGRVYRYVAAGPFTRLWMLVD